MVKLMEEKIIKKSCSPSFMIASQLGAVQAANSIEQAASHCEQYVEVTNRGNGTNNKNVVAYHDWRLPTEAEIKIIYKYQDNSDAMDVVLSGNRYWSASGLVAKPGTTNREIKLSVAFVMLTKTVNLNNNEL